MSLVNKIGIFGSLFLLTSCAAATFPDFSDEEEGQVLVAGEGLGSDSGKETDKPQKKESKITIAPEARKTPEKNKEEPKSDDDGKETELMSEDDFAREAERIRAAKTTPVIKSEDIGNVTKTATSGTAASAKNNEHQTLEEVFAAGEEDSGPSVTYRLETFYFSNGSAFLDNDYQQRIREIVKIAKENNAQIRVLGHASSRTRNTDIATHKLTNFKVSQERAEAVAKALRRAGLPASQISIEALSDSNPAYLEVMPEGERLNRRAEVYISY